MRKSDNIHPFSQHFRGIGMPALDPPESLIPGDSSDVTGDLLHIVVGDPTLSKDFLVFNQPCLHPAIYN